jgi:peptide chain release factor 1
MLDKLAEVEKRYVELEGMMSDPQLLGHQREYSKLAKERSELEEIVSCYREWRKVEHQINDNRQLLEKPTRAFAIWPRRSWSACASAKKRSKSD